MTAEKPTVYILHGEDGFALQQYIDQMVTRLGDPGMAELNTVRLDGRQASNEDIRTATLAMPFLAERRLVILIEPFAKLNIPASQERFLKLLDGLPSTTAFVLQVTDKPDRKKCWEVLHDGHWLMKWVHLPEKKVLVKEFSLPRQLEMPGWIQKQAQTQGGSFSTAAAVALAANTGNDTALAALEIDKLLTYVNRARPIEPADVDLLVAPGGPVDVWETVEALASGNNNKAMRLLHGLLENQDPSHLFGLIVRQFRLLIQVREILDEGGGEAQVVKLLNLHTYVDRLMNQARRFPMLKLEEIYHRLLDIDEDNKTSQVQLELSLELLLGDLSH